MQASKLRFYLHDLAEFCQIQMFGEFTAADVPELSGCYTTVKPTLKGRKLVIDVRRLDKADAAGEEWLAGMQREGAEVVRTRLNAGEATGIREGAASLLRLAMKANRGAQ